MFKRAKFLTHRFTISDGNIVNLRASSFCVTLNVLLGIYKMLLKFKSHINFLGFNNQIASDSFQKLKCPCACNHPTIQSSMFRIFAGKGINSTIKSIGKHLYNLRIAHVNTSVNLVSVIVPLVAIFWTWFCTFNCDIAFSIEKTSDIRCFNASIVHPSILHDRQDGCQQHMFNNVNSENSVDTLTSYVEGNTEPSLRNQEGVSTMHGARKGRYSQDSWETMRGSRNDYPPVRVFKVTDCNKDKLNQCAKDAAEQQAIYVDTEALSELYAYADADNVGATAGRKSGLYNMGYATAAIPLTETNILRYILMAQAVGDEQNWPSDNRFMVLPTWATFLLNNSDIKDASLTGSGPSNLVNGRRIGKIGNFTLYQSNLYTPVTDTYQCYNILFGHRSAISFAAQLNEVEYFDKLEGTVGKGMRGIQLYDWKVTKPASLGVLYARMG